MLLILIGYMHPALAQNKTFTPKIKANSIWWFIENTNFSKLEYGDPVNIYFFGDASVCQVLQKGSKTINGATPKLHRYHASQPNAGFLSRAHLIWVAKGKEWFAIPKVHKHRRYGECWVVTQQDLKNGGYEVRYVMKNGKPVRDAQGNKIKHTIWTLGSMANVHQHPRFGFQGNKSEVKRRNLKVSSELQQLMKVK